MTEDDEHELFRLLRQINDCLWYIGGVIGAAAGLWVAHNVIEGMKQQWGWSEDWAYWLVGVPIFLIATYCLGKVFDRL